MLKTIGLTTFPKNRLKANQALFRGAKADGIKMVTREKIIDNAIETIANNEECFHWKNAEAPANIAANNQPNFWLEGVFKVWFILNSLYKRHVLY